MAGANFIGVCTYPIMYGKKILNKLNKDINSWLNENNYSRLEEIVGLVQKNEENIKGDFVFTIEKCTKCKKCEIVCAYNARKIDSDMYLDKGRCRICGLCSSVCPTGALKLI